MKCLNCQEEIESDDNFCWKCGHWTAKGYTFLKNPQNINMIEKGDIFKQNGRFSLLTILFLLSLLSFFIMLFIQGNDLFRPIAYLKKQINNYIYGYNTTLVKTDNKYKRKNIDSYEQAIDYIQKDFDEQSYLCNKDGELYFIENKLEEDYSIPSVFFCDMSLDEASKISKVIEKMYQLFPSIKGALTNITITNAPTNSEYIARFQPIYQFINVNENIKEYNKVNKTQILLNSYYFLNEEIISNPIENVVGNDWYVKDATWESTIAHEIGHYISFYSLLRKYNLENAIFVTFDNNEKIENALAEFDSGEYSNTILQEALNNYNANYGTNLDFNAFSATISKYANTKDKNGKIIADETIAEAIHDYYLHGYNMKNSSFEIIKVLIKRLN